MDMVTDDDRSAPMGILEVVPFSMLYRRGGFGVQNSVTKALGVVELSLRS